VSQSSDDAPTGSVAGRAQPTPEEHARRWSVIGDLTAAVLLVVAVFLPWNLYFGTGIPGSSTALFAALLAVTLLSLVSIALAGSWRSSGAGAGRLRLALNVPYLLLVLTFVGFDVFETVRWGGTVDVPGGIGPGAWLGTAGSLLAARMPTTEPAPDDRSFRSARIIGYASMAAAVLSFCFNLYWRVRYALQSAGGSADFGRQNIAVIATAVVYGAVALIAVLAASRWLLQTTKAARLATVALGASALVAGTIVWLLPVGREIDAFHGIAQNTSTAGVGFEGYLAWVAAAAIFAPATLFLPFDHRDAAASEENAWRSAARSGLALIAIWCVGSMAMRLTDLLVAMSLNYPFSRYDSVVLATFDMITAVLAVWLRANLVNEALSARLISSLCGLVTTLSIARVVVGVALAPRFAESSDSPAQHPVYGNNLAQQITSTFDVTLCVLGLSILAAAIVSGRLGGLRRRRRVARAGAAPGGRPPSAVARSRVPAGAPMGSPATGMPSGDVPAAGSPRIVRGAEPAVRQIPVEKPRIYRPQP
jgi:hypothetical protein